MYKPNKKAVIIFIICICFCGLFLYARFGFMQKGILKKDMNAWGNPFLPTNLAFEYNEKIKYIICTKGSPFEYSTSVSPDVQNQNPVIGNQSIVLVSPKQVNFDGLASSSSTNPVSQPEVLPNLEILPEIKGIISGNDNKNYAILSKDNDQIVVCEGMTTKWGTVSTIRADRVDIERNNTTVGISYDVATGSSQVVQPGKGGKWSGSEMDFIGDIHLIKL